MSFLSNIFGHKAKVGAQSKTHNEELKILLCPYCNCEIITTPVRNKKCKNCNNNIIIRTHYKTKDRVLLTEADVAKFDVEKEKYYIVTSFLRGLKQLVSPPKMIDPLVIEHTEALRKKMGAEPSFSDVAWGISNLLTMKYPDLSRGIHFQQAIFLHNEGKDPTRIRLIGFKEDLMQYVDNGAVNKVEIITTQNSCEACKKLKGKVFTVKEALEKEILPCKECSFDSNKSGVGWCRCCYSPYLDF